MALPYYIADFINNLFPTLAVPIGIILGFAIMNFIVRAIKAMEYGDYEPMTQIEHREVAYPFIQEDKKPEPEKPKVSDKCSYCGQKFIPDRFDNCKCCGAPKG